MRLTVLGATGGVGRLVVREALGRGHAVHALVRDGASLELPPGALPGLTVTCGEALDPDAVTFVARGADAVVSCLGIRRANPKNPWSRLVSPADLVERATRALVGALAATSTKRLVFVSAAGVGDSAAHMSPILAGLFRVSRVGEAYRDLARAEAILAATDLDWLAVRPVTLIDRAAPEAAVVTPRYRTRDTISRAAVAAWMLEQVAQPTAYASHAAMIRGDA